MARGDSFGCLGLVQGLCCCLVDGLCGLVDGLEALLLPRPRPGGFPATNPRYPSSSSSQVWRTGSPRDVGISYGPPPPVPRATNSSSSSSPVWRTASPRDVGIGSGHPPPVPRATNPSSSSSQVWRTASPRDVRIDSGPRPPVPPVARNPPPQQSDDDDDDDCVIIGQKGEVACRDFPHSRHLCSNMPLATTSHEKHCPMCYCFVCDAPAPCAYWGKGLSVDDHCHATDKETKWKTLRQAFKQRSNGSGTSNGHAAQTSQPLAPTVTAPRAHSAAGAGRATTNGHTAQISRPLAPTVSAPRAHPAPGAGRGTSNTHTAQSSHSLALTVSGVRASSATRVQSGTSNGHSAQVTHQVEPTVIAPRPHPAAGAGRGSSNAHSVQITYPANGEQNATEGATVYVGNLPSHIDNDRLKLSFQQAGVVLLSKVIYDRETRQSRGFGFVTMNTVQEAEAAVRMYNGSVVYGRPLTVRIATPRGSARVDTVLRQSGSPLRIYVCNLPPQVDRPRLEELFSKHGKVVDARVIYEDREGVSCSKGFGFVTMATEEESHSAIRALNKQVLEGQTLLVKVARERPDRGSPSLSNQASLQNAVGQNQNTHTSVRASPSVALTVGASRAYPAARARSGTSNADTAQVAHRLDPTRSS